MGVTTSERDLPMLTATMEDILEDTDMAVMVTTSERDLPMLKAITVDTLEDTDMEVTDITLERDLLKPKASHTTATRFVWWIWLWWIPRRKIDLICHLFIWSSDFVPFYDVVIIISNFNEKVIKSKFVKTCIFDINE